MAAFTENDEQSLCAKCTSNAQFAKWIEENGSKGRCDFDKTHGRSNAVVTADVRGGERAASYRGARPFSQAYPGKGRRPKAAKNIPGVLQSYVTYDTLRRHMNL